MPAFFCARFILLPMKTVLAQAQSLIESGFAAQGAGRLDDARKAYAQALRLVPEHPTALQLLGLIARNEGELNKAQELMRRSLAVYPAQPHVWNNLANTLEALGDIAGALECLDRAVQLQAHYAEAHYNRARLLWAKRQADSALEALSLAMQHSTTAQAAHWALWAQIIDANEGPEAALKTLEQGLQRVGAHPTLLHDQGVLLQRMARYEEALACHDQAAAMGLQAADAHYNRGNTLQSLGRLEAAERAYLQALERSPGHRLAHYDLARLLWRQARDDWMTRLDVATLAHPSAVGPKMEASHRAELLALKGDLLWRSDQLEAARQAYEAAWHIRAQADDLDGMARCAVRLGDVDGGLALHRQAVDQAPGSAMLWASMASSLLVAGRLHEALDPAQRAVDSAAQDQMAWALLSTVYRHTHPEHAQALLSPDLMAVVDLPPPKGWMDTAGFHADLVQELEALHHDQKAPVDQTLRGGTQTLGKLFDLERPCITALRSGIALAIEAFLSRLPSQAEHPLLGRNTGRWRFSDSWSSRLSSEGRHTNHVHPHGWISAVYYVQVPAVCTDTEHRPGWLQFGVPDEAMNLGWPPLQSVQPAPGRLVLFPSYWWHGTRPFLSPERRTTIAFDVLPV